MTQVPLRLEILKRLTALLEGPLTIDGEEVSMEGAVFRGRNIVGEEVKPLPIISIIEAPRPDIASFAGEGVGRHDQWTLLITGRAEDDAANPSDSAYYLYAAVEERLGRVIAVKVSGTAKYPEHHLLGGLISSLEIAPPVVRPPDDKVVSASAYFFLPIRVGIASRLGEPYTSGT